MEWRVTDVVELAAAQRYALTLCAEQLKLVAVIASSAPVTAGERLYPVQDAKYLINKDEHRVVKVISAAAFTPLRWKSLQTPCGLKKQ
ncbi:TPA: polymyxin B resistance protein pmrD [Enterobacter sichuanensis]|uniref:polymyxin B resistance protein pmrD n=1 Tax=Enterobacter sichuanensis TaxID=2071710 RepID=UPI00277F220B|nr:polymyxin B resistance protein pmrD [Enterobacter sichuanensis]